LDPGEGGGLVEEAVVAGGVVRGFGGELGVGEEAEDAEAVVHGDDDYVAMGEELAVLTVLGGAAADEAAAEDPDHDGEGAGFGVGGGPDVEGEAVFAGAGVVEDHVWITGGLDAVGSEVFGGAYALPVCGGLRRLPAEIAGGRGGEGYAFEGADLIVVGECAFDYAVAGLYLEWVRGLGCGGDDGEREEGSCEEQGPVMHEWIFSAAQTYHEARARLDCEGDNAG
jgi:hypothetical protein